MVLNYSRCVVFAIATALSLITSKANDNFFCDGNSENCYCSPAEADPFCGGGDASGDVWA